MDKKIGEIKREKGKFYYVKGNGDVMERDIPHGRVERVDASGNIKPPKRRSPDVEIAEGIGGGVFQPGG